MGTTTAREGLIQHLDDSMSWRRMELAALKTEMSRLNGKAALGPRDRALIRSAVVLAYAHWEGFVKDATRAYAEFVRVRRLKYSELSRELIASAVRERVRQAQEGSEKAITDLVEAICGDARADLPRARHVVPEIGNMNFCALQRMFQRLGLPLGDLTSKNGWIDNSLCDARHQIAHGVSLYPPADSVEDLISHVLNLLAIVKAVVVSAVIDGTYRRSDEAATARF